MDLPDNIAEILRRFDKAGYTAYCVGGCVRDALRGETPHDWDLCTAAHPDEIRGLFSDVPCRDTGIRYGTVTVIWNKMPVEITTFRREGVYQDHRSPKKVAFSLSLHEDCQRRDFSVNAMAYHPACGIIDDFGGMQDLSAQIIRCVGEPEERFNEDALRILRALRFASTLDFRIEEQTEDALFRCAPLLVHLSKERIAEECRRLIDGAGAPRVIRKYRAVLSRVMPFCAELSDETRLYNAFSAAYTMEERLAALFYLSGIRRSVDAYAAMQSLPFGKAVIRETAALTELLDDDLPQTRSDVRICLSQNSATRLSAFLRLRGALCENEALFCRQAEQILQSILVSGDTVSLSTLAVGGSDIAALGFEGSAIGACLRQLLDMVMRGTLPNERIALLNAALAIKNRT